MSLRIAWCHPFQSLSERPNYRDPRIVCRHEVLSNGPGAKILVEIPETIRNSGDKDERRIAHDADQPVCCFNRTDRGSGIFRSKSFKSEPVRSSVVIVIRNVDFAQCDKIPAWQNHGGIGGIGRCRAEPPIDWKS